MKRILFLEGPVSVELLPSPNFFIKRHYLFPSFQELQDDIIENAYLQESVTSSGDNLIKFCEEHKVVDVSEVRNQKQDLADRWENLKLAVKEVGKTTANTRKAVTEFEDRVAPVEEMIVATERKLDEDAPFSWDLFEMEEYVNKLNVSDL